MKFVKITKKILKMEPKDLLIALGAVDLDKGRAFPECVYMSKKDYLIFRKNLTKTIKKCHPLTKPTRIQYFVGIELLNLGPNESLENAIKPGYILVDTRSIQEARK